MRMLSRRLQILIDERRFQRLSDHAEATGMSIAAVIRELVDTGLPPTDDRRAAAARRILAAEPMPVPDPAELRAELDDARDRLA